MGVLYKVMIQEIKTEFLKTHRPISELGNYLRENIGKYRKTYRLPELLLFLNLSTLLQEMKSADEKINQKLQQLQAKAEQNSGFVV